MSRIALCGGKGHGKTTLARYLECYGYTRISFGTCLRNVCKILFGLSDHELWENKDAINPYLGVSARDILKHVGTEIFRHHFSPNVWVDYVVKNMPLGPVVIDDLRFQNELEDIKKLGFQIYKIESPEPRLKNEPSGTFPLKCSISGETSPIDFVVNVYFPEYKNKAHVLLECLNAMPDTLPHLPYKKGHYLDFWNTMEKLPARNVPGTPFCEHESERGLNDPCIKLILNDGTLEHLYSQIE